MLALEYLPDHCQLTVRGTEILVVVVSADGAVLSGMVRWESAIFPLLPCNQEKAILFILSRFVEEGDVYIFTYREEEAGGETQTKDARGRKCRRVRACVGEDVATEGAW